MKKVLITGSNGLLGQKLVKLLANKEDVRLLATSSGDNRVTSKSFDYQRLDITDNKAVQDTLNEFKPDVVINTAAMTNVDACENDRDTCWKVNVDAVGYLLDACETVGAKLIHLSTDFVFDGEEGPYKEEDQPNPLSFYGESKLASEQLLLSSTYKNWAIARTIIVYGIGENMSRSNIVLWAMNALKEGKPLSIVDDQFRSPTWADDLAMGCWLIAEKDARGIFHLSGKDIMSILQLVKRVADFYNLDASKISPVKSETLNQVAKRPPVTGFVLEKAIKELGYAPLSFEEGLEQLEKELKNQ
ncbi:dTDP-4-dehydrorhamnose reductase [Parvicella tangerina]|uniref:dTDP-4-dehydrorhamnose reductase n=1 Tax=Parvicella tangerina TaxID=2829795 RepID=A0A916NFB6_9FLAO|nr:dTDP-4-dehydrorhamnose reductase [Parvicella tangerina]CAG5078126.1 dTDP-4-dehydrorhamnose reductase [Parvicella tangerina]